MSGSKRTKTKTKKGKDKNKMANVDSIVRSEEGLVDVDASVAKFAVFVANLKEQEDKDIARVLTGLNTVFDKNKGVRLEVPTVVNLTMAELGCSVTEYKDLSKLAHEILSNNKKIFSVKRGRGGGVGRVADLPADA